MSGGFDILIQVEGNSLQQIGLFVSNKLATLENVTSTATHFVLKKYKEDGVVLEDDTDSRLAVSP